MAYASSAAWVETPADILRKNGRSFNFARAFLTEAQGERAARLYAFCRYVDDLADETGNAVRAKADLDCVQRQLVSGAPVSARIADFLDLAQATNMDLAAASALVEGVASDLQPVAFDTTSQLLRYAYKVAGTVGLMMCAIFEVDDAHAAPFAIDLGIAMQLTNIARDIREDALKGRRYVPGPWLSGASAQDIAEADPRLRPDLALAAERLIDLAELYYESAYNGFGYLPVRSRFAILIAARVYRQIGLKIARNGYDVWHGRTVVSSAEKIRVAGAAAAVFATSRRLHRQPEHHNAELHISLNGLAGVHEVSR